jgi:hypothetical protein
MTMHRLSAATSHLGVLFGGLCGIAGLAFQGIESAVIWSLVGYFLGKSVQSTLLALSSDHTT